MQSLVELFSKEPASFTWSTSDDGTRTIGTCPGCVLDILPDRVEMAGVFPPDNAALAARNGTLFLLLLTALRPDWSSAAAWLAQQMRLGVRSKRKPYDEHNITRRVRFVWDHARSRAAIRVKVQ